MCAFCYIVYVIRQVEAIHTIEQYRGLESLDSQLEEIAQLRLQNPDISMLELGQLRLRGAV